MKESNNTNRIFQFIKKLKERKLSYIVRYIVVRICMVFYLIAYRKKEIIVFNSIPNMSDNTKPVFDEMVKRKINDRYALIWITDEDETRELNSKNCYVISTRKIKDASKAEAVKRLAICIISCNQFLYSSNKKCTSFYLNHGIPIKNVRDYYSCPQEIDYMVVPSKDTIELFSYCFNYPKNKIIPLGAPRNDAFYLPKKDLSCYFEKHNKYIIWYPTFRQHKLGFDICESKQTIPLIDDVKDAETLNEIAKKHNFLIIIKPHFAQNVDYIKKYNLSNIVFIDDSFFVNNEITSYELIASSDALITDYSSVYYDYLLCNKPIGLIWNDIEEYKKNPGLIEKYEYYSQGGVKIYNFDQLLGFMNDIATNEDKLIKERNEILKEVFDYRDSNNSIRVTDFIIDKSNIKNTEDIFN